MTAIPPPEWVQFCLRRTDPHPYAEWCYCQSCADGALLRAALWGIVSLLAIGGVIVALWWLP